MKKFILIIALFSTQIANACTVFGAITKEGTILGKNRDYFYGPQKVGLVMPLRQFNHWHGNQYHHHNKFFALTAIDGVAMGVNLHGLTAIEEDTLKPIDAHKHQRFLEPKRGTVNGMVLYAVLQNFNTIDEIIPYLSKIFSVAAPDFYQFSDANKILTVEVAFGENDSDLTRQFNYNVLSKQNDSFTHTNLYLDPKFSSLNKYVATQGSLISASNRLLTLSNLVSQSKNRTINEAEKWFLNTFSNVFSRKNNQECLNTGIFRSNLQGAQSINLNQQHDKIYGTASSMIISNQGNLNHSEINLKIINSISTTKDGHQIIKYKVLNTNLANLFSREKLTFINHQLIRPLPKEDVCY